MSSCQAMLSALRSGACDGVLSGVYALDGRPDSLLRAKDRIVRLIERFLTVSAAGARGDAALFSSPGRTELGGNHTDHQHGHVLCGSVDLDILACAAPNGENVIRVCSEGYPTLEVSLDGLSPRPEERNASAALVRGVAARMAQLGCPPGGFDACVTSAVPSGYGLSSSAAYEVLIGSILNHFFCGGRFTPVDLAVIGQYAENIYFGKPCGLMDQVSSAVGGAVAIDFADPAAPAIRQVRYDFSRSGHALCIVDTGSCHADLTGDYAAITREMGSVAAFFGRQTLREVPESAFRSAIPQLRSACGDRAVLRAMHFYAEDRRAVQEADALEAGDFDRFLSLVNDSGLSSALNLQNTWPASDPGQQAIPLALAVGRELLGGAGAIRVHGGGFSGAIQAFVPNALLASFRSGMETLLGSGACHLLQIRPQGGCVLFS